MATEKIIKDPVTGNQYSRDTSVPGSTFAPYTPPAQQTPPPAPAQATPEPTTTPTESPYYPRYTNGEQKAADYLAGSAFQAPESAEDIQARMTQSAQGEIDSINAHYADLLKEQQTINEGRNRSTASVSTLTGLAGSTEANVAQSKTTELNKGDNQRIQNEKLLAVQTLLGNIRRSAVEEARQSRLDARADAESILAGRTARQEEATTHLTALAGAGATADGFKTTDPEGYDYLVRNLGGEEYVKALFTLNRPSETILDKRIEGGKYIIAYQNPLDGGIRVETLDLGLPPQYSKTVDAGDRILAVPDNWSGDPSELITINKGLTPSQQQSDGVLPGENPQLYSGLSSKTATAVRSKVTAWKSEPVVENFSTIQEGRNFAGSLANDTTNPADDQALIYALAKALDPGSVVREGEYATAQKYAQSWVQAYGKAVTQALAGTGFLSEDARRNIKDTIESRYKASKTGYDNLLNQYTSGINTLTGRGDGSSFLTDYAIPEASSRSSTLLKDGQQFDASELTEEEYDAAVADGYIPQ